MFGIDTSHEISILHKVDVSREGYVDHFGIEGLSSSLERDHFLGRIHDFLGQRIFDGITGDQASILGIGGPSIEQLSRDAGLEHAGRGEDDRGSSIVKGIDVDGFEVLYVGEVEGVAQVHLRSDASIHHIGIGLVDPQGPTGHFGRVVDGDGVQVRVVPPVLVEDEEELLRPAEGKDGNETSAAATHDRLDRPGEDGLPLQARLVHLHPVGALHDEHVRLDARDLRRHEMAVFFHGVVPRVQHRASPDLDEKHGRAEDVARVQRVELEAAVEGDGLVVVDEFDLVHARLQLRLGVQHVVAAAGAGVGVVRCRGLFHRHQPQVIPQQQPGHGLGRVRHEDPALEPRPLRKVRQAGRMVQMEMRNQ